MVFKFKFIKRLQSEFMLFIVNFASSSSVVFTEFMLSSSSFCQVQNKFKTPSTVFVIEFEFRNFCFSNSAKKSEFEFAALFQTLVKRHV